MNVIERKNRKGDKITFYFDYGRGAGERGSSGIFVYTKPKNEIERRHNKEARDLIATKKSETIIEQQAVGSAYIPKHKFKANFLDYYEEYAEQNKRKGNRHLLNSLTQFKLFIDKDFVSPAEITENLCKRFRAFLLDKYTGATPTDYFTRFKWVIAAAESDGYFRKNPTDAVAAKGNPSTRIKENLEVEEYFALLNTPCLNEEVQAAFIVSCYTGLRWVDIKKMKWTDIKENQLTTRMLQAKTKQPVVLSLHPIVKAILDGQRHKKQLRKVNDERVFTLPSADGANGIVGEWVKKAGIQKHITWSCARLSFSILLQDQKIDDATVACLLGHTTTEQVRATYKRHRPKNELESIQQLPTPQKLPFFLNQNS